MWLKALFLVVMSSSLAYAQPPSVETNNQLPNNLGLFTSVGVNCPFNYSDVESRLEGEFLRANLVPSASNKSKNITVTITCLRLANKSGFETGYAINSDIRFGSELEGGAIVEDLNHGGLVAGGTDAESKLFYLKAIQDQLSQFLTGYIRRGITKETTNSSFEIKDGDYILQLLALRSHDNAIALVEELRRRGYDAYTRQETEFTRVLVVPRSQNPKDIDDEVSELQSITGSKAQKVAFKKVSS
ncbi:SPOR domain-containing protein [Vibrio alginolyticus]|uniref:SPOR domain-containing protein n=1 Tax=Vibrio alginolyticus TaxID=663 RepID=UPI001BD4F2D9|nr:SPOR domain-containing protein [Vibrio alginolyticus]MBT0025382.1 SPOR domain-containing protein [Vibrio alginolyticus]